MKRILLAGATGYLGSYIARELLKRDYQVTVIARNPEKLKQKEFDAHEFIEAQITQPESINNCCKNIDAVISAVGITRQKDGLTYMDVDFQANMNLLQQAKQSGVKKFISDLYGCRLSGQHESVAAGKTERREEIYLCLRIKRGKTEAFKNLRSKRIVC
jgi:nucleoside-diphosphate-sugar epimerase